MQVLVKTAAVDQNVTLSGAPQTLDSIPVAVGDKVLCASQTLGSANGIYTVQSAGWTKDSDLPVGSCFAQAQGRPRFTRGFWRFMGSQLYLNPPTRRKKRKK